jgi:hypothetical protein
LKNVLTEVWSIIVVITMKIEKGSKKKEIEWFYVSFDLIIIDNNISIPKLFLNFVIVNHYKWKIGWFELNKIC